MGKMTVSTVLMRRFICASIFRVNHRTVSGVTIVAVFMATSCAMVWMTVEMEVMRKKNTVENQRTNLAQTLNTSVAMGTVFRSTMCVIMWMTVETFLTKLVAI